MYSPDIPTASPRGNTTVADGGIIRQLATDLVVDCTSVENYYSRIETEESVKCVVSSLLFLLILIAFFLVAILINPEM